MTLRGAVIIAIALLSAGAARAEGRDPAQALAEGERRYGELDYRGAATSCEEAARDEHATPAEQARGWSCVGTSWLVLNQRALAKEAFDRAFSIDPRWKIDDPSLSPRQREFIDEIRAAHPPPKPKPVPVVVVEAPPPRPPPPPPRRPVYKRWYLWTPIVLVGAGLGVGLGLGLTLGRHGAPVGTLPPGTVAF